ncbi:MAG: hypothetical protein AAGA30_18225, partial [Planctomycetota bacterium]
FENVDESEWIQTTRLFAGAKSRGYLASKYLTFGILMNLSRSFEKWILEKIQFDLIKIVLALEAYRFDRGEFPNSLSKLSPDYLASIPVDRFSQKELIYEKNESGYSIHAAGADAIFQSNNQTPKFSSWYFGDIDDITFVRTIQKVEPLR